MPVRKRLEIKGSATVFITTTVISWIPIFNDNEIALVTLDQLKETMQHFQIKLIGYVLMPSHLHMVIYLPKYELLSEFMQSFKVLSSRKLKPTIPKDLLSKFLKNGAFRFWKPRFDDLVIVSEKHLRTKLDYIHNNPVKAGLVNNAADWIYSSAVDWLGDGEGHLKVNKDFSFIE